MSLQPLPGFTGYNQQPLGLIPEPMIYGPAKNPYNMDQFKESYKIPLLDDYSFRWEVPYLEPLKQIVRDEIVKYEASSDFKPLTFISLPKSFNQGLYEQMKAGNYVKYTKFTRTNHLASLNDQNKPKDLASLYTQTELKSNDFLSMLNSVEPYKINAQSTSSIQDSQ